MQVEASVDEADIGQVKVGQEVSFTVDAFPNDIFKGKVKQIRLLPIITMSVVTYTVIIEVNNPDLKLLPGLTANIKIIIESKDNVLKVPNSALRFVPDEIVLKDYMKSLPDSIKQKYKDKAAKRNGGGGSKGPKNFAPGSKGKIWIKKDNQIAPARVVVGLTDGSFTEVSGKIKEGDEVITNIISKTADKPAAQNQNPFAPTPQRGTRRGM
jgi:HlyD family secretion protein